MDPRFERFLKKPERKRAIIDPNLEEAHNNEYTVTDRPTEPAEPEEPTSMYDEFVRAKSKRWLDQDHPAARATFNVINKTLHPERPVAKGLAIIAVKGTSFADKRAAVVGAAKALRAGEYNGEVHLVPEPENPYDQHALAVVNASNGEKLGYIPRRDEINKAYKGAIAAGRLCGAYIIEAKLSRLKGEESALLMIATGWLPAAGQQNPAA